MRSSARLSMALAALIGMGCTSAAGVVAEKAADSMEALEWELAWIAHSMDGMTPSTTPEEAVNASAGQAAEFWTDGCFMFSIAGPSITYTLADCTGPFGLSGLSGDVTVTYNDMGSGIGFDIVAMDLAYGDKNVSFTINADVSTDGRNVNVTTMGSVIGRRSHVVTWTGSYAMQWNGSSMCAQIEPGTVQATIEGETFSMQINNWARCGTMCPRMGGTVTFTDPGGSATTLTYGGSNEASWSGGGESGSVSLFCG